MYGYVKRSIDIVLSLILIIVFSPIMVLLAILIRKDGGEAIFKQERSGKNNVPFIIYKFRTMSPNNDVHDFKCEDRMTKIGRKIKNTSLDELPQLFNILKGDMSFIGPRPWITDYAKYFNDEEMHRLDVKPGLTGLAQCKGRNNISIIQKINYDLEYVKNVSFKMDLYVFFKTIKSVLVKDGSISSKFLIKNELDELRKNHLRKAKIYEANYVGALWN